jgi:alpha/beta superfamily hydrolase
MHNNVVGIIVTAAPEAGLGALAFNFRGVGRSGGSYDEGRGEQDDAHAAIAYARSLPGVTSVALAGYSFGAGVASNVIDASLVALALVAAPTARLAASEALRAYDGPSIFVAGSQDHVSAIIGLREGASGMARPAEVVYVEGADHFWWGHEATLQSALRGFFATALAGSRA